MNGEHLKKKIEGVGWSQKDLAQSLKITPQTVNNWCSETKTSFKAITLEKICSTINKPMSYLYEGYKGEDYTVDETIIREGHQPAVIPPEGFVALFERILNERDLYKDKSKEYEQQIKSLIEEKNRLQNLLDAATGKKDAV